MAAGTRPVDGRPAGSGGRLRRLLRDRRCPQGLHRRLPADQSEIHRGVVVLRPTGIEVGAPDRRLRTVDLGAGRGSGGPDSCRYPGARWRPTAGRSEEHTSELQSRGHLVCRLLLEKKKKNKSSPILIKKKQHKKTTK